MSMFINPSIPCMSPIAKNTPYFLNFTPYFHDCKTLLLSFEFYPLFSRAGGKLLFWKNPSEGSVPFAHCSPNSREVPRYYDVDYPLLGMLPAHNNHLISTCKQLNTACHQWNNSDVFTYA